MSVLFPSTKKKVKAEKNDLNEPDGDKPLEAEYRSFQKNTPALDDYFRQGYGRRLALASRNTGYAYGY